MSTIEPYVTREIMTAVAEEKVADVVRRMCDARVGAVVLTDGSALAGLFTERDLLSRVVAEGLDPAKVAVGDVATREVISVALDAPIKTCAQLIRDNHIRHLPVTDGDKPVGIVSARDFFDRVASHLEDLIERVRYDEELRKNLDPYDHLGGSYGR
ncbi:MAG: CBS domain-containing protein [Deltaproteobacteria bacterium]|nr:CBS domain-containing protein [Deltaproteobacteria bacterium]